MFRAILVTQWKWTRAVALAGTVVAFALPLVVYASAREQESLRDFIEVTQRWGGAYALLATGLGLFHALSAWQQDHAGRHIYALSLPVSRARYAGMRLGAGSVFLLAPILALLLGALVVTVSGVPTGLQVYPFALTLRFAFASFVAYAIFFAIASATPRTAAVILIAIGGVLFTQYLVMTLGSGIDIIEPLVQFIFVRPGILSIFAGRWMLVDV